MEYLELRGIVLLLGGGISPVFGYWCLVQEQNYRLRDVVSYSELSLYRYDLISKYSFAMAIEL